MLGGPPGTVGRGGPMPAITGTPPEGKVLENEDLEKLEYELREYNEIDRVPVANVMEEAAALGYPPDRGHSCRLHRPVPRAGQGSCRHLHQRRSGRVRALG